MSCPIQYTFYGLEFQTRVGCLQDVRSRDEGAFLQQDFVETSLCISSAALERGKCDVIKVRLKRREATRIKTAVERSFLKLGLLNFKWSFYCISFPVASHLFRHIFMTSHMTLSSASSHHLRVIQVTILNPNLLNKIDIIEYFSIPNV